MKNKIKPYLILLLTFLLQGANFGIICNLRGIFYKPVCQSLDFELGGFTSYTIFYAVAILITTPVISRIIDKVNLKAFLTIWSIILAITQYSISYFTQLYQWYIASAIQGAAYAALCVLTVPILINNWFSANRGLYLGISAVSGGIFGSALNPYVSSIISTSGWEAGYRFMGILVAVMLVPSSLLLTEKGSANETNTCELKGTEQSSPSFITSKTYISLAFYFVITCLTISYSQLLSSIATSYGYSKEVAAGFISTSLIGSIIFKIIIGFLIDIKGIKVSALTASLFTTIGFMLLLFSDSIISMYIGSFLLSIPMTVSSVVSQSFTRLIFGNRNFKTTWSSLSIFVNLSSNFGFAIIGWFISFTNSYVASLYLGIILSLIATVFALLVDYYSKKEKFVD